MYPKPKAIFFDFDGVIVESADIKTHAFLELFQDFPEALPEIKKFHLDNVGISRFKKFEWIYRELLKRPLPADELTCLGERFSEIVLEKVIAAPYVPGAEQLLRLSKSACLNFVASGTPEEELKMIVEERSLSDYFRAVCGSPRTKGQIVKDILSFYALKPDQCWFVGDANTDHEAAQETGLRFIARSTPELAAHWHEIKDIWVVDSLEELVEHFDDAGR